MFVRTTRIKRGDKVYEYPQLVESYRQDNGTPTHRVIASLKDWAPEAVENLRQVLASSRSSTRLVADGGKAAAEPFHRVLQNLDYLSIAVLDERWKALGLGELLDEILPSTSICSHGDVVRALVLHRCVDPGSKWSACRWYPTTSLPERLGIKARYLNNSRVHRALEAVGESETVIQARVGQRVLHTDEGVVAAYLDLTDTWFVGRGPPLSTRGRTKEGLVRQKVGIALLCDQRGFPLRWDTVEGSAAESTIMLDLLRGAVKDGVVGTHPVVMDRAMGRGAHMSALADSKIAFVTAIVRPEFSSFVRNGPWGVFGDAEVSGSPRTRQRDLERLAELALDAGMTATDDGRFVLDLGVACCPLAEERSHEVGQAFLADLLAEVDFMEELLASGSASSMGVIADWYGVSRQTLSRYRRLSKLAPQVRERVLAGQAEDLYLEELQKLADLPADAQLAALEQFLLELAEQDRERAKPPKILDIRRKNLILRRVVWFSPELLLQRRTTARAQLASLESAVAALNAAQRHQAHPRSSLMMLTDARALLKKRSWLRVFNVTTRTRRMNGREHHEIVLARNDEEWQRRRRLDGFGVIAASPLVRRDAASLLRLYFSKDVVEKDFRMIKSELDIRPVHHRTDLKVRAHVTVCMLALLLRRSLEHRMAESGVPMSADAAHEELATCHLNRLCAEGGSPYYAVTSITPEQRDILTALGLEHLGDTGSVVPTLRPR